MPLLDPVRRDPDLALRQTPGMAEALIPHVAAALDAPPGAPHAGDPASRDLLALAARVAASEVAVVIEGPTGAGKEVLARHIHRQSPRAERPFLAVNCAALPEAMLEAMLFGHERGAFTGAAQAAPGLFRAAHRGTLFLDEVGEMPLPLQAKLLRAVQEREVLPIGATSAVKVDVRLLAATNRSLAAEVAAHRFREDLFYRLAVFPLRLLPLAARPGDLLPLIAGLLVREARATGQLAAIDAAGLDRLRAHHWPGNVRELDNVLRRAMVLAGNRAISPAELVFDDLLTASRPAAATLDEVRRDREFDAIEAALAETGGRRLPAATRLGISERTLRYKLAEMARIRGGRPAGAALQ
ncbi:MAG: sigma 54-interacting transcriptional regulator [Alphaproteobacteria bacterium]|nr:sigma 54-interacting transcriptional regulator [Alphaproteobacteria bacterium]